MAFISKLLLITRTTRYGSSFGTRAERIYNGTRELNYIHEDGIQLCRRRWPEKVLEFDFESPQNSDPITTEINRNDNPSPRLARTICALIRRTHEVPTGKSVASSRRLLSRIERAGIPGDDSVARQRALVCDPVNNEQWSDDLPNPVSAGAICPGGKTRT